MFFFAHKIFPFPAKQNSMSEQLIGREKQWTCQIFSSCVPDLSKKKNLRKTQFFKKDVLEF